MLPRSETTEEVRGHSKNEKVSIQKKKWKEKQGLLVSGVSVSGLIFLR